MRRAGAIERLVPLLCSDTGRLRRQAAETHLNLTVWSVVSGILACCPELNP